KPSGERILIDPAATQLFGYKEGGTVRPRVKVEVFSDIEDPTQLLNESYAWLMENNTPKAVFSVDVADGDGLNLGDEVYVIYRDIDLVKPARVSKVIDDLISGDRDVEFGDVAYFNTDRRLSGIDAKLSRVEYESASVIYRMKLAFDERFDEQVKAIEDAYEQALIDANANIEAAEVRMQEELDAQRKTMLENIEQAEKDAREAGEAYADEMENRVNTAINTTRTEMESSIENAKTDAIQTAEQNAEAKKQEVQSKLDSFKGVHQQMYDEVTADIIDINEFLGPQTEPLNAVLNNMENEWQNKLDNVDTWHYNMLRGTKFDEGFWSGYGMDLKSEGNLKYFEYSPGQNSPGAPYIETTQEVIFEEGETYRLSFDFQTFAKREVDYIWLIATENEEGSNLSIWHPSNHDEGTHLFTHWGSEFGRYWLKFTMQRTMRAYVRIGANMNNGEYGKTMIKIANPYLTTTDNTRWLYHPEDSQQNIEEVIRRVTQLEDGREEFISRTEYDNRTG